MKRRHSTHRRRRGRARAPRVGGIIYWVRSMGPGDHKDLEPMYFVGRLTRNTDEGHRGDIRARPTRLGKGEYTGVYAPSDFTDVDGKSLWP